MSCDKQLSFHSSINGLSINPLLVYDALITYKHLTEVPLSILQTTKNKVAAKQKKKKNGLFFLEIIVVFDFFYFLFFLEMFACDRDGCVFCSFHPEHTLSSEAVLQRELSWIHFTHMQ